MAVSLAVQSAHKLCTFVYISPHTLDISRHSNTATEGKVLHKGSSFTISLKITQHWGAFVQPLLQWKGKEYYILWVCVCSLRHPARNAHAPYCHLWPAPLYDIFPHYLINGTIFEKRLLNTKCVLIFCTAFVWNISYVKKKLARCDQKCTSVFMYSAGYCCRVLRKLEFFRQILEK